MSKALRFAIIGAGPAGLFSAKSIIRQIPNAFVDIFDKLPSPYGLIRYGVAPDHTDIKSVINDFSQLLSQRNVRFFGNVEIGKNLKHQDLQKLFSGIIYCYGTSEDNELNIKGGQYSYSARKFVEWYNSHPLSFPIPFKNAQTISVIGNGNVAIDAVRILSSSIDRLNQTEISTEFLNELAQSKLREINIIGRRGCIQGAMTVKELRALARIPGVGIRVFEDEIKDSLNEASRLEAELEMPTQPTTQVGRAKRKIFDILNNFSRERDINCRVQLNFRFLQSPVNYDERKLTLERNQLYGQKFNQMITGTGILSNIDCDLLMRSIGYKAVQIDEGIPFDTESNVVQNQGGRIEGEYPAYAAGWCKTGPFGIIDTTMRSVFQTMDSFIDDHQAKRFKQVDDNVLDYIENYITFEDWRKIDQYEIDQGKKMGKVREKVKDIAEIFQIIK